MFIDYMDMMVNCYLNLQPTREVIKSYSLIHKAFKKKEFPFSYKSSFFNCVGCLFLKSNTVLFKSFVPVYNVYSKSKKVTTIFSKIFFDNDD